MIGRETRVLLRHYLEQGASKAEVARRLGVSRRTVHRWIASGQLDRELDDEAVRYGPRRSAPSKLDRYKGIIEARLAAYPKLSAVRLYREVRAAGYAGGYDQVKRQVREVRPREPEEPVRRFETPPGHQGQVDFADFRLPWGKRHALVVVLGYSRHMWLRYYERQTMRVVMRGLESSFAYFGGVPSELLFDQMKAVITADGRAEGGRLLENGEFLRFSRHWGFRIHGTLKERPADRFEWERPYLAPLAARPYRSLAAPVSERKASRAPETATPRIVEVERRPLADFDFSFQPSIKREQIDALHELGFVRGDRTPHGGGAPK